MSLSRLERVAFGTLILSNILAFGGMGAHGYFTERREDAFNRAVSGSLTWEDFRKQSERYQTNAYMSLYSTLLPATIIGLTASLTLMYKEPRKD